MAEAIQYEVPPPRIGPTAREELDRLLETCHRHGVLRFANDLVASNTQVAEVLVKGLQSEGVLNATQNLAVLLMALSCIPPAQFYRLVFAVTDGAARVAEVSGRGADSTSHPPGLTGALRLLHDEQLWRAMAPLVEGLKAFAEGLGRTVENPISDFSGKQGRPS
jgi:uncharacterized protein YjgD (DUF1641 family)